MNTVKKVASEKTELLQMLRNKKEKCVVEEKRACVTVGNKVSECRNSFKIDDFDIDDEHLSVSDEKCYCVEVGITNDTDITYEHFLDDDFGFIQDDTEIHFHFAL